ncbi:MAG: hypothetical protein J1E40_11840 [Oscillospiraceae bacterium]|nr:hypothetical protein [Oscillospiraceae bacterium]
MEDKSKITDVTADSNNNPLDSYLWEGEYFLWLGEGRSNFKCPLPFAVFFLVFALIWTILALQKKFIFAVIGCIAVGDGIGLIINSVKGPPAEYYGVTNLRVMALKGKRFEAENLGDIKDIKIHPVSGGYSNIEYLVQVSGDSVIHSPGALMRFRSDGNFNRLESSEAERVRDLIISEREKVTPVDK